MGPTERDGAVAGRWLAWDRELTRVIACGPTRAQATAAAREAGEADPVLEDVAATRERFADLYAGGAERRHALLDEEGGPLAPGEVGGRLRVSPREVEERRAAGSLLGVPGEGGVYFYPAWQFTGRQTLRGLGDVLAELRLHNRHPLAQLRFFLSPNPRLGGKTPLQELRRGRVAQVRRAARAYGEQGAP